MRTKGVRRRLYRQTPNAGTKAFLKTWRLLQRTQHLVRMTLGLDAAEFLLDLSIWTNDERAALDTHHFLAIHVLFFDDAQRICQRLLRVRQEREGYLELFLEFLQSCRLIGRHSDDHCPAFFKFLVRVTKLGRLDVSTRSVGLGEEVQDQGFPAEIL